MAIEKGLYAAPTGLDEEMEDGGMPQSQIEIEIEDPESVKIGMDGLEIVLEPGEDNNGEFDANLAEDMEEGVPEALSFSVLRGLSLPFL